MKKYLIAKVGKTGNLYFVPDGDRYNGLFVDGKRLSPVPLFSFIERRNDIFPVMKTNRQKRFWKLDFRDSDWSTRHNTENPGKTSKNPYNKKALDFYDQLEEIQPVRRPEFRKSS